MAHNTWTNYMNGERWVIVFDIVPEHGYRILMDGFPGVIASDDDFGINGDGLMITETTITQFEGWDPEGTPEFVRARKAMQDAARSTTTCGSCSRATTAATPTTGCSGTARRARSPSSSWA